ncbi:50S ribosomal protein L22 [Candidatus Microgenomates bacterium]|nr:50S ribosomal protein L22 [Candidatus Microgenomates bacterium]
MTNAIAKARYLRISPRKMLGVCKLVRGKNILVARAILSRTPQKGALLIGKVLDSAVANAKMKNMEEKILFIDKITADMGPHLRRMIPWSRGSGAPIRKKTTHLTIVVAEDEKLKLKLSSKNKKKTEDKSLGKTEDKAKNPGRSAKKIVKSDDQPNE